MTTDQLAAILRERNVAEWRAEVFPLVQLILAERGADPITTVASEAPAAVSLAPRLEARARGRYAGFAKARSGWRWGFALIGVAGLLASLPMSQRRDPWWLRETGLFWTPLPAFLLTIPFVRKTRLPPEVFAVALLGAASFWTVLGWLWGAAAARSSGAELWDLGVVLFWVGLAVLTLVVLVLGPRNARIWMLASLIAFTAACLIRVTSRDRVSRQGPHNQMKLTSGARLW